MTDCRVCSTPDEQKPQIFRGEDWCCDRHKKIINGEILPTPEERDNITDEALLIDLFGITPDEDKPVPKPKKKAAGRPKKLTRPKLDGNKL